MNDILFLIISLLVISLSFSIAFFGKPFALGSGDEKRAFLHISAGSWGILWLFFESKLVAVGFVLTMVVLVLGVSFFARSQYGILSGGRANKIYSEINFGNERFLGIVLYLVSLLLITFFFWDKKLIGTLAILALSLGDGFADIVGKKYGKRTYKLPWVKTKTYLGSLAGFLASYLGVLAFLLAAVVFDPASLKSDGSDDLGKLIFGSHVTSGGSGLTFLDVYRLKMLSLLVALTTAVTEAVSPYHTDNITIPVAVVTVLSFFLVWTS